MSAVDSVGNLTGNADTFFNRISVKEEQEFKEFNHENEYQNPLAICRFIVYYIYIS